MWHIVEEKVVGGNKREEKIRDFEWASYIIVRSSESPKTANHSRERSNFDCSYVCACVFGRAYVCTYEEHGRTNSKQHFPHRMIRS